MPDTTGETFEGYERSPKEVRVDDPALEGKLDWDAQLEKRSAQELQISNNHQK